MSSLLEVDGTRPGVAHVAGLPRTYRLTAAERLVLFVLACDSFDAEHSAPGYEQLCEWTGLYKGALLKAIGQLVIAVPGVRPALLERTETTRGRNRTVWRLLVEPVAARDRLRLSEPVADDDRFGISQPVGRLVGNPVGQPVGARDQHPIPGPYPSPHTPETQAGDHSPHPYEPNATQALTKLVADRGLRASASELLPYAYRLGSGDPFRGYQEIKHVTEAALDSPSVRDPRVALFARLKGRSPVGTDAPKRDEWCQLHENYPAIDCAACKRESARLEEAGLGLPEPASLF